MYEALIREGLDAEDSEKFDRALEEASDPDPVRHQEDRMALVRQLGGQV